MTSRERSIAARMQELLDNSPDGLLHDEAVVMAAKNPEDVLHAEFNWDDAEAAHLQRLSVARRLIRSVKYVERVTRTEFKTPNYVRVTLPSSTGYMPIERVRSDKEIAQSVIREEVKRARAALERARNIADVIGLRDELEDLLERLMAISKAAA